MTLREGMKRQTEMLKLIRRVHTAFAKFFTKKFQSGRVTLPQYMMLMILSEEGAQKMNSLAKFLHVSTPSVTNLVDRLEAAGYARRIPHPTDRRAHVVELTPAGKRFIGALRAESLSLLADTIGTMPAREQAVIERFYLALLLRLEAAIHLQRE